MASDELSARASTSLDRESLRDVATATVEIAEAVRTLDAIQNNSGKANAQYQRAVTKEKLDVARQAAQRIATTTDEGRRLTFPITLMEVDAQGATIARRNDTIVADILTHLWQRIAWINRGERLAAQPDVMYRLDAFCDELSSDARKLRAILRAEGERPNASA